MCGAALMLTALSQAPVGLPHHPHLHRWCAQGVFRRADQVCN
jgi:hypothetical protein